MAVDWDGQLEEILRTLLSEENTDALIESLADKVNTPWWLPKGVIVGILDQMLPEVLLEALLNLIRGQGEEEPAEG